MAPPFWFKLWNFPRFLLLIQTILQNAIVCILIPEICTLHSEHLVLSKKRLENHPSAAQSPSLHFTYFSYWPLKRVYELFSAWCGQNKRLTNVANFGKLDFDMASKLSLLRKLYTCCWLLTVVAIVLGFGGWKIIPKHIWNSWALMVANPRNNSFPVSLGGKANDTAVTLAWLQHAMMPVCSCSVPKEIICVKNLWDMGYI